MGLSSREPVDLVVIGAGAAGMMCAATAGELGQRVVLIDHATKLAEKIRISGGGRCNFTNRQVGAEHFISGNPHFCKAALAAYTPQDFIDLVDRHGIRWHEKHRGQLFCDESSEQIIAMLKTLCDQAHVQWQMPAQVQEVRAVSQGFELDTSAGLLRSKRVVVATGGTAIPQVGATDFGLRLARVFGLRIVEPRPALVPLKFDAQAWAPFSELAGLALQAEISVGHQSFLEDMLFTHRGLSGPGILQISSYWQPGESLSINLLPGHDLAAELITRKGGARQQLNTVLAQFWPKRLAERLAEQWLGQDGQRKLAEWSDRALQSLGQAIGAWQIQPVGTEGFKKAEVMKGGVDTAELHQRTFEARRVPGLYFIGEVVDVTGWLGGYNFQWAWSSGVACARAIAESPKT
jgi:predicted Rossmann fold flavoprotein